MSPSRVSRRIVLGRLTYFDEMLQEIESLPLGSVEEFKADKRNVWSAESCLRRALEALFDTGRHILAKGFASGVSEYKETADALESHGVLTAAESRLLKVFAGYRNRMVHFYHEITQDELYGICSSEKEDLRNIRDAYARWLKQNPDKVETTL